MTTIFHDADGEEETGHARLQELLAASAGPDVQAFEADLRTRLGSASIG